MSMNAIHRAQSGLNVAQRKLQSTAHNTANMNTEGHQDERTQGVESLGGARPVTERNQAAGSDPVRNAIEGKQAQITYSANLAVLKVASDMQGELVDLKA